MQLPQKNKNLTAIIIVLALVFVALMATIAYILTTGFSRFALGPKPTATEQIVEATTVPASPTPEAEASEEPEATPVTVENTPTPSSSLDPQTNAMLDKIEDQVRQVRKLSIDETVPRHVYTPEELRDYVTNEMLEEFDEMESKNDLRRLALLGLMPDDLDLRKLYEDLYSEQIAGFYKIDEREMVVVSGEELGINERLTYAHEYVHALQYANYDFENELNYNEDSCKEDSERCIAIKALIEGDATMSQFKWFEAFATQKDVLELLASFEEQKSPVLDSAPVYLSASMMFPYEQGAAFVEYLYNIGGYNAIHTAFTTTPPLSSEQIMFPERYPDDLPVRVELPNLTATLGAGWESDSEGAVGAWDIYMMLTKGADEGYRIGEDTAKAAVEGWGGDSYAFLSNDDKDEHLFVMKTVWDTDEDSEEAYTAMVAMLRQRLGQVSAEGIFGQTDYFARIFRSGDNGFVLIISETLDSLNQVYEVFTE